MTEIHRNTKARPVDSVPMPARIARLPRNHVGYPIPWFVAVLEDGTRDFRIASAERQIAAIQEKLCWVCGHRLGGFVTFTIGPMCAVNRLSSEPPAHRDCATYSAQVCPFLAKPKMHRRPIGDGHDTVSAGGETITRNPGVTLLWTTRRFRPFRAPMGHAGLLFDIGDPTGVDWYRSGRTATRAEILDSIETGLPALREACQRDADPKDSLQHLDRCVQAALKLLPTA